MELYTWIDLFVSETEFIKRFKNGDFLVLFVICEHSIEIKLMGTTNGHVASNISQDTVITISVSFFTELIIIILFIL